MWRVERRQAGFSLIEILVAMAVLALVLSPLLGSLSQAARLEAAATERSVWADEARSILDLAVADPRHGATTGTLSDGTSYVVTVREALMETPKRQVPVRLFRVELDIGPPGAPAASYATYALTGGAP